MDFDTLVASTILTLFDALFRMKQQRLVICSQLAIPGLKHITFGANFNQSFSMLNEKFGRAVCQSMHFLLGKTWEDHSHVTRDGSVQGTIFSPLLPQFGTMLSQPQLDS